MHLQDAKKKIEETALQLQKQKELKRVKELITELQMQFKDVQNFKIGKFTNVHEIISEKQMGELDVETVQSAKDAFAEKMRQDKIRKLKQEYKRIDHLARTLREFEGAIIPARCASDKLKDEKDFEEMETALHEQSKLVFLGIVNIFHTLRFAISIILEQNETLLLRKNYELFARNYPENNRVA